MERQSNIVLAMTGASGVIYGVRLLEVLLASGCAVHVVLSNACQRVFEEELDLSPDPARCTLEDLIPTDESRGRRLNILRPPTAVAAFGKPFDSSRPKGTVQFHALHDYSAGIASGSFKTTGMVICPCSMGTLASVASGLSSNLIHRAADVHLKERRKLIIVPRETPLGLIALDNMRRLTEAGGVILPAMPGFYHKPNSMLDLVDFVVTRICDQLGIPVSLTPRWGADGNQSQ